MHTNESSNTVFIFDFISHNWKQVKPNIDLPKIDSQCAVAHDGQMYIYGGYVPEKAELLRDIYVFDLEKHEWKI